MRRTRLVLICVSVCLLAIPAMPTAVADGDGGFCVSTNPRVCILKQCPAILFIDEEILCPSL